MTRVLGILNVTPDSFSDGGRYLDPAKALAHADHLFKDADAIDLGGASSHPDARVLHPSEEIARLQPVLSGLVERGLPVSVDSFQPQVQRWACKQGARWINDIHGFPDPETRRFLADQPVGLIAMFSVQQAGNATRVSTDASGIVGRVIDFFDQRLSELEEAGVDLSRVIVDPGMGFFLGSGPEPSLAVLRALPRLRERYGLPVLVGVSRKSFLRRLTGATLETMLPSTVAGEVLAAQAGADWLRTHDAGALRQALTVLAALRG